MVPMGMVARKFVEAFELAKAEAIGELRSRVLRRNAGQFRSLVLGCNGGEAAETR